MTEPYFKTDNGKYYHGDAVGIMKTFPDGEFDMIFTDPPFFTAKREHETGNYEDFVRALPEMHRVLKDGGWLLIYFPSNRIDKLLADTTKYFEYKDRFVVEFKSTTTKGAFGDKRTLCVMAFAKGKARIRERFYTDTLPGFEDPFIVTLHPRTALWKPTFATALLMRKFIRSDRAKILDPFAGYGSILIVAEKLGHEWVGIDVNEEAVKVAKKVIVEGKPVVKAKSEVKKED